MSSLIGNTLGETTRNVIYQYGILQIFPFVLVFTIVYALLETLQMFGNDNTARKLRAAFAFGYSLMCIAHKPFIDWLLNMIPLSALVMVSLVMFLVLIGLLKAQEQRVSGWPAYIMLLAITGIFVYIGYVSFTGGGGGGEINVQDIITPELFSVIVIILLFLGLVRWFTKGEEGDSGSQGNQ